MAYARPSSPQSIGGVVDDGFRLFTTAFGRCWLLAIIPGLVLATYDIVFPVTVPVAEALRRPELLEAFYFSRRMIGLDLLSFLLTLLFQGAVVVREIAIARGDETMTFGGALARSLKRLPGMVLASILDALATLGGLIALIVPGVWLGVRLQLWTVALFAEDVGATEALGASWRLTRGHWWRAAAILSVALIMIIVLVLAFSLIAGIAAAVSHFSTVSRTLLVYLVSLGSNAIYYPLGAAIWIAMYHDFKLRREGGDLESRVGALSGAA